MSAIQQYVVDQTTAEGCFPIWRHWMPSDGVEGEMLPPTVTHLPGPIVCETCEGNGQHFIDLQTQIPGTCPDCEGRGYPPRLEIVSEVECSWDQPCHDDCEGTDEGHQPTVHGVVTVGPPDHQCPNCHIPKAKATRSVITDAIGTCRPGQHAIRIEPA
jgi:hypothetical protein